MLLIPTLEMVAWAFTQLEVGMAAYLVSRKLGSTGDTVFYQNSFGGLATWTYRRAEAKRFALRTEARQFAGENRPNKCKVVSVPDAVN